MISRFLVSTDSTNNACRYREERCCFTGGPATLGAGGYAHLVAKDYFAGTCRDILAPRSSVGFPRIHFANGIMQALKLC